VWSGGVVEGAVLEGVGLLARGVAQLALVLLQDRARHVALHNTQRTYTHKHFSFFKKEKKAVISRNTVAKTTPGKLLCLLSRGSLVSYALADIFMDSYCQYSKITVLIQSRLTFNGSITQIIAWELWRTVYTHMHNVSGDILAYVFAHQHLVTKRVLKGMSVGQNNHQYFYKTEAKETLKDKVWYI
jgi:hypothetical protein